MKITEHEEVISQSLCVEETKTKVVNYLSKVRDANTLRWPPRDTTGECECVHVLS